MKIVTIHEAKTHLSRLIQESLQGEDIVIARGSKPLVRLVVLDEAQSERRLGTLPDLVRYMAPDFDDPLDDFKAYAQ